MSISILTPLDAEEIPDVLKEAIPSAEVDDLGDSIIISEGRFRVMVAVQGSEPITTAFGKAQAKVIFSSEEPPEGERPLETSMGSDVQLSQTVRAAIKALKPMETEWSNGKIF